jgi:hypothetical protein
MKSLHFIYVLIALGLIAILLSCGGNSYEDGLNALENKDYNLAIKYLSEARKEIPANPAISEKLALAYILRGKDLYQKRKNISAFTGNFSKGEEFIPAEPSEQFQVEYSNLLLDLANAYQHAKPENDVQKEDFLNKTIASLETALGYYPDNSEAESLLNQIKSDNFTAILEKGKRLFSQAKKENNKDLYFTAEYYFKKANNFDSENKDALIYLAKTRKQTLDVLDVEQDFALAIADEQYSKGSYIFEIYIQNNAPDPIKISHNKFVIMDKNGNSYPLDKETMSKFKTKMLPEKSLTDRKTLSGIIAFKMKKKIKIDYIGYKLSEEKTVKKYFP